MSNKSIRMDPTSHDANHSSCGLNPPLPTEGLMSCPEESDMHPKKTVIKALINNDLSIIFFFWCQPVVDMDQDCEQDAQVSLPRVQEFNQNRVIFTIGLDKHIHSMVLHVC